MRFSLLLLCCFGLLSGCAFTTMTRTGPVYPPREPKCPFQLFTTPPWGPFVEIGVVDSGPGPGSVRDLDFFREIIQPYVCFAGGDAVIAFANGQGYYIKATILKQVAPAAPPPGPPAGIVVPTPDPNQGCHYDTQCKGVRICVNGTCVSPPAAPTTAPAAPR